MVEIISFAPKDSKCARAIFSISGSSPCAKPTRKFFEGILDETKFINYLILSYDQKVFPIALTPSFVKVRIGFILNRLANFFFPGETLPPFTI